MMLICSKIIFDPQVCHDGLPTQLDGIAVDVIYRHHANRVTLF